MSDELPDKKTCRDCLQELALEESLRVEFDEYPPFTVLCEVCAQSGIPIEREE